jgi:hypothetical protein
MGASSSSRRQAVGSSDAIVTLRGVLISRVDTGGEHRRSAVTMQRSHVVEIPALARRFSSTARPSGGRGRVGSELNGGEADGNELP